MKYIVTGGAGFIGSNLVDKLLVDGHDVIVIDSLVSKNSRDRFNQGELASWAENPKLLFLKKDINFLEAQHNYADVDAIFHLAALPNVQLSIENPIEYHKVNINGTLNMLYACVEWDIKRFIFSSSSAVYGEPAVLPTAEICPIDYKSPYALHKVVGEQYCQLFSNLYGIETVSLRYFNVYGNRQPIAGPYSPVMGIFANQALNKTSLTINGSGEQTRDFVHVDDVVRANILSANMKYSDHSTFNIGSGLEYSVNALAELFKNGLPIKYKPPLNEPLKSLADINKAKNELGWTPKTRLINWIEDYKVSLGI